MINIFKFIFLTAIFSTLSVSAQNMSESELAITKREDWNAKNPVMEMKPHKPQFITIHHTGMPQKPEFSTKEKLLVLQNFSQNDSPMADGSIKKVWPDVPYHFYVATNGEIAEGRDINFQGDSNTDYDLKGHVLIVVEGNFNKEKVLPRQWESLKKLVSYISSKYDISRETISGHKDQAETTCPGQDLYRKLFLLKNENRVKIGAENLFEEPYFQLIKDKKIGLITNHTGVLPEGEHLVDLLHENPKVKLTTLFGPEHGIRGEEDTHVSDSKDIKTGLPIISLYGKNRKPSPKMLQNTEVLIFDIQDIGVRFYTYISTMLLAMEAAAENNIPFIVLDRPNPISGNYIDGPIGKPNHPVTQIDNLPITHGMTVGELATMFNEERKNKNLPYASLTVVPLKNYSHKQWYDETGLPWIKPSPNMLNLTTATLYPTTCLLEGTNVSEGRGTLQPFEYISAPWINPEELIAQLKTYNLEGIDFESSQFTPNKMVDGIEIYSPKFMDEEIPAVELILTDRDKFKSVEAGIYILHALQKLYPKEMEWREERLDGLLKNPEIRKALEAGENPKRIIEEWKKDLEFFNIRRTEYLMY